MDQQIIILALTSLFLSGLFSGIEIAFISANRLHIELQAKKGNFTNKILSFFVKKPAYFIGTSLIGNTISLVVFSTLMTSILNAYFVGFSGLSFLLVQTIISTIIVLIFAEYLPKSLFLLNPNRFLNILILPFVLIGVALAIPVFIVVNLSKFLLNKVLRSEYEEVFPAFSLTDLNHYVQKISTSENEDEEQAINTDILNNALEFKTVKVRECMIPRTDIVALDIEESIEKLRDVFIKSGYSKIPIFKETIDNVVGYVHSSVLFKKPRSIEDVLSSILIVPETFQANELLPQFLTKQKSIALVVDEFGGTAGIVTIEDVIEEITGEIQDEHDEQDLVEVKLDDNSYLFSARHEVEYLNENYQLDIPEEEYDTLGGYVLHVTGDIPKEGDVIDTPTLKILIKKMAGIRIDKVQIFVLND